LVSPRPTPAEAGSAVGAGPGGQQMSPDSRARHAGDKGRRLMPAAAAPHHRIGPAALPPGLAGLRRANFIFVPSLSRDQYCAYFAAAWSEQMAIGV